MPEEVVDFWGGAPPKREGDDLALRCVGWQFGGVEGAEDVGHMVGRRF